MKLLQARVKKMLFALWGLIEQKGNLRKPPYMKKCGHRAVEVIGEGKRGENKEEISTKNLGALYFTAVESKKFGRCSGGRSDRAQVRGLVGGLQLLKHHGH